MLQRRSLPEHDPPRAPRLAGEAAPREVAATVREEDAAVLEEGAAILSLAAWTMVMLPADEEDRSWIHSTGKKRPLATILAARSRSAYSIENPPRSRTRREDDTVDAEHLFERRLRFVLAGRAAPDGGACPREAPALASRASFARAACAETAPPVARRGRRASGEDGQHDSWQLSMSEIRPCAPQLPAPAWYARATAYGGPETCTRHRAVRCLLSSSGFFALVRGKGVIHPQIAGENVWLRTRERSTHIPFRGVRFHIRVLSPPLYATLPAASHEPPIHPW
mgnify:CR=1 FL=1